MSYINENLTSYTTYTATCGCTDQSTCYRHTKMFIAYEPRKHSFTERLTVIVYTLLGWKWSVSYSMKDYEEKIIDPWKQLKK